MLKKQKEQVIKTAYLEVEKTCKIDLKIPLENAWFFYALNSLYLKGLQTEKLDNHDIISKVVQLVEQKAQEIEKKNNGSSKKS